MSEVSIDSKLNVLMGISDVCDELLIAHPDRLLNIPAILERYTLINTNNPGDELYLKVDVTSDGFIHTKGLPIYECLPGESLEYFRIFKAYMKLPSLGYGRTVHEVSKSHETQGYSLIQLDILRRMYSWDNRAKAGDIAQQINIDISIRSMKKGVSVSNLAMFRKIKEECEDYLMDKLDTMKPSDAIKLLELSINGETNILNELGEESHVALPYHGDNEELNGDTKTVTDNKLELLADSINDMGILSVLEELNED